jgi:aerobic-type carbon monoxide dehydrogenase small subunit (CoxS/CutS family)
MERYLDISLRVNGEDVRERVAARKTLVDFLRDDLGLTGSHIGCEQGVCGACTVMLDGAVVRGCLLLAVQCDGAEVETIEGMSDSGAIADLQDAFQRRNALQCGFCTPGMLIGAQDLLTGLLGRGGVPSRAAIREHLAGNYCRCTGYQAIVDAIESVARTRAGKADELEERMMHELGERIATKSVLFRMADGKVEMENGAALKAANPDKYFLMGADARLPKMPKKPTLIDFFNNRFASLNHLLQSATHALKGGHSEKVVLACLLHDIGVAGFIRCDHGYWGAQMIEPYVDEEVSWAVRTHQALRFFPDPSVGYEYPEMYIKYFGADYKPEPYIVAEYERAKKHKYYMTSRMICVNDIYSFDPNAKVDLNDFVDIIGRNFKQPEEGLGFDDSPSAHMWRTLMWPTRFL